MKRVLSIAILVTFATNALGATHAVLPLKGIPKKIALDNLVQVDEAYVGDLIAEGLFDIGEGFQINPVLAESVSWKNDGKTLNIKLKKASFSDGQIVTVDDVTRNLLRCIKHAEEALSLALLNIEGYLEFVSGKRATLAGLKKISDRELEIVSTSPSPLLPDALTFSNCHIIKGSGTDLLSGALGTGAYRIDSRTSDKITLAKRTDYHRENLGPDAIEFRPTDTWGNFDALKSWATLITMEGEPGNAPDFNKFESSQLGTYQLIFNNARAPFNKEQVRQAIVAALDFHLLAAELGWSKERLQAGLFPFGMRGFKKREVNRDVAKATQILKQNGYTEKNPLRFTITIAKSQLAELEQKVWPRVFAGAPIVATVELLDQKSLFDRRSAGTYEALRVAKMPGSVDGHRLLTSYLSHSKFNTPRSVLPDCDKLIKASLSIANIDARYEQYERADACLMSHVTLIPLATIQPGYALLKKPWAINRESRYNLRPYNVYRWRPDGH